MSISLPINSKGQGASEVIAILLLCRCLHVRPRCNKPIAMSRTVRSHLKAEEPIGEKTFMQIWLVPNLEGCLQDLHIPIGMGHRQHFYGCGEVCAASSSRLAEQVASLAIWQPVPCAPSDKL